MLSVEEIVKAGIEHPGGFGNIPRVVEEAGRAAWRAGASRYLAESAPEDVGMLDGITAALTGFGAWTILIIVLLVIMALKVIENLLSSIFDLPIPFIGDGPRKLIHLIFSPLDSATTWLTNYIYDSVTRTVLDFALLIRQFIAIEYPNTAAGRVAVNPKEIQHLQGEIDVLQGNEAHLQSEITSLQHSLGSTSTTVNVDTNLAARVKRLENQYPVIAHDIAVLWDDVQLEARAITQLQGQVKTLRQTLNGVHETVVSWQDLQTSIENELGAQGQLLGQTAAQTGANTDQITLLAPLAILLGGGMKGIKVLRSLENRPCQCPRFGGLPGVDIDALAMLEFLENG